MSNLFSVAYRSGVWQARESSEQGGGILREMAGCCSLISISTCAVAAGSVFSSLGMRCTLMPATSCRHARRSGIQKFLFEGKILRDEEKMGNRSQEKAEATLLLLKPPFRPMLSIKSNKGTVERPAHSRRPSNVPQGGSQPGIP